MRRRLQADADRHGDLVIGVRRREPVIDFQIATAAQIQTDMSGCGMVLDVLPWCVFHTFWNGNLC